MASAKAYRFPPAAVLRFTGEDHFDFLQGQGTADLRGAAGLCRYSLWLDHRGQIQGDGFILRESDDSMLLVSYASPGEQLMTKFDRHIIADDVEMDNLTDSFEMVSVTADDPEDFLQSIGWEPLQANQFQSKGSILAFAGRRTGLDSIDFLMPSGESFSTPAEQMGSNEAESLRIQAGVPLVPVDTMPKSLNPIEANIISALSFNKGCYLGQEVVARVHRLERITRRLVLVEVAGGKESVPAEWVIDGSVVGGLSSVVDFSDKCIGIGWLKGRCEDGEWNFDGTSCRVRSLPAT